MFGAMVSMRDYEDIGGFGIAKGGPEEVDSLNKALTAGYDRPPASGGGALRVESLEATLRVTTFTQQNIRLWRGIPKLPAYNTVEEYNLLTAYGSDGGAFTNEGDLPETQDSTYQRKTALIKFQGETGEISHPMLMVRPAHGNVQALETQNRATDLLTKTEIALFKGRSDIVSQEPDGLEKQILDAWGVTTPWASDPLAGGAALNVIDKRGGDVTEDDVDDGTNLVAEQFGAATDFYGFPKIFARLAKSQFDRKHIHIPPAVGAEGRIGYAVTEQQTNAGLISYQPDVLIRPGTGRTGVKLAPTTATSTKAPNAPVSVTAADNAAPQTGSKWLASDAGSITYVVTAFNRFGESTGTASAAVAVAAGDSVTLTIVDGGGANPAVGYRVYRTADSAAASTAQLLASSGGAFPKPAAGPITYTDLNYWLPGCGSAFLVQRNLQNFSVRQLAPMLKIPLATVAPSIRWMQLLYWTEIVYSPKKNVLYINVKD
jgi:hypothetical protein